jgi:hypothetical protein
MDALWRRRLASRPTVVLDWGYIRSMRRDADLMPLNRNYILPEVALQEAATTDDFPPAEMLGKLLRFVKQNHERVFVASHLSHLIQAEPEPGILCDRLLIVQRPFFQTSADAGSFGAIDLDKRIARLRRNDPYKGIQREFEDGRTKFALSMNEKAAPLGRLDQTCDEVFERMILEPCAVA